VEEGQEGGGGGGGRRRSMASDKAEGDESWPRVNGRSDTVWSLWTLWSHSHSHSVTVWTRGGKPPLKFSLVAKFRLNSWKNLKK
jgi:hypothetical protein